MGGLVCGWTAGLAGGWTGWMADGRTSGRAAVRARGWTDTTWPVVMRIVLISRRQGGRTGAIQSGVLQNNLSVHLDRHITTQTSRWTNRHTDKYIQSPDGQTGREFLFPLLLIWRVEKENLFTLIYSNITIKNKFYANYQGYVTNSC